MKVIKKVSNNLNKLIEKLSLSLWMFLVSSLSYAGDQGTDIVATLIQGTIGKTLSKDGHLWEFLIAVTFVVGTGWAAVKNDPKAFIPAFIVMGLISTVTGVFLSF